MKAANAFVEHGVVGDVIGFAPSLSLEVHLNFLFIFSVFKN